MSKEKKDESLNTVTIMEDWVEIEGTVFYRWKRPEEKDWHYKKTPYKQKPVVQFRYMTEEEFGWLAEDSKDMLHDWEDIKP